MSEEIVVTPRMVDAGEVVKALGGSAEEIYHKMESVRPKEDAGSP